MNIILNVCKYFFISAAIITAYFWCDEMLKNGLSQKKLYIYAKAFLIFLILFLDSSRFSASIALLFIEKYWFWTIFGPFYFSIFVVWVFCVFSELFGENTATIKLKTEFWGFWGAGRNNCAKPANSNFKLQSQRGFSNNRT